MNSIFKIRMMILAVALARAPGISQSTPSADIFVATNGNDAWSGKLASPNGDGTDGPFASVAKAQEAVRALAGKKSVSVMLRGGIYYLPLSPTSPGTIKFSAGDSGTSDKPIAWLNYPGETPVINGGVPVGKGGLNLTWKKASGNLWQVQLPENTQPFSYLFYNGERRLRARAQSSKGVGFYMQDGACHDTQTGKTVEISQCNLGTFLRMANSVSPDHPDGEGCRSVRNPGNPKQAKCLDRFYFKPEDPIAVWSNLKPVDSPWHKCSLAPNQNYPEGDVEITIFNAWTVDVMKVSCINPEKHIVYFTNKTNMSLTATNYSAYGPWPRKRYVVENAREAFEAAQAAGQSGLWFLGRSTTPWTLNYLARKGEDPNTDNVVIAQVRPVTSPGGSLVSAYNLKYVTFRGITFEVDNWVLPPSGFNIDQNTEYMVPAAVDCESCQNVTFDAITVRRTSGTGLVIAPASNNSGEPARDDVIQNSAFYDVGDCGIRLGRGGTRNDKAENVVQFVIVQNNIVQGYSRVFPSGEGISLASGHDVEFLHNDITDGYHAALSVCDWGCTDGNHQASGNNLLSEYNHIWNIMQGITSDGGTLYYSIGDSGGSGKGNKVLNNLVHDTTSAEIIDGFPDGYGGRGIYLDAQSAGVQVENNVVYNMSQDVAWMSQGPAPGQPGNIFSNNIFAHGLKSLFHGANWPGGCKDPSLRAAITNNIFYFTHPSEPNGFNVLQGCSYSCGLEYKKFLNFQGNLYWRTDGTFDRDEKAFHIIAKTPESGRSCAGRPSDWKYLTFAQWQSQEQPVSWGPPGGMNLDTTGTASVDPGFGKTGKPTDFLLRRNPMPGFDYTRTNDTILHAGRTEPVIMPPVVPHTFPTYSYTKF